MINSGLLFPEYSEASRYHDAGKFGFVTIATKKPWKEDKFLVKELPYKLRYIDKTRDSYLTQAEFKRRNRRLVNFYRISDSFIDLDTYKKPTLQGRSKEELTAAALLFCSEKSIPRPNLILFSGRGLYLKWLYDSPIPYAAFSKWNAMQAVLVEKFAPLGADRAAVDIARVLRIENTVNTESGEFVQVIYDDGGSWNFDDLAREVLPHTPEEYRRLKDERQARQLIREMKRQAGKSDVQTIIQRMQHFTFQTLAANRLWDIQNVIVPIQYGQEVPEGMRDKFLFAGGVCISKMVANPVNFERELREYHRNVVPSLAWREVRSSTSSIRKRLEASLQGQNDKRYRMTTERLVNFLEVSPEVQRQCQAIISAQEKKRRHNESMEKKRRSKGVLQRAEYEEQRKGELVDNIRQARELKRQGMSRKDIAQEMGKSLSIIDGYLYRTRE